MFPEVLKPSDQLSQTVGRDVLNLAYYGLVDQFLAYAVAIWGFESSKISVVFKIQKRALKTIWIDITPVKNFF